MARFSRKDLQRLKKKQNASTGNHTYTTVEYKGQKMNLTERDFYMCLEDLKRKGFVFDFEFQKVFRLIEETIPKSDKQPATYVECINASKIVVDFYIPLDENLTLVVDTKGRKPDPLSRLKYNLLRHKWYESGQQDHLVLFVFREQFNVVLRAIEMYLNGDKEYFKRISHKMAAARPKRKKK